MSEWGTNIQQHVKDLRPVSLIVILVVAIGLGWWLKSLHLPTTFKIPGPWYLKFTNLCVIYVEALGHRREWIHQLHLKYGPVVQIAHNEVSFVSYTAAKQIYVSGSKDFEKTDFYDIFQQRGHINLFTARDPHVHAKIKKPLADRYSNSNILKSKVMDSIAERAQEFVKQCLATRSADVYLYLHAYALDCVTSMLFHPYNAHSLDRKHDRDMVHLFSYANVREGNYYFPALMSVYYAMVPGQQDKRTRGRDQLRRYMDETLAKSDHSDFTLVSRLKSLEDFPESLTRAECMDHMGAGVETTGDCLCFLLRELSQPRSGPIVMSLRRELQTATSQQDLANLSYLNAVVQEALRLWAPGTLTLPRHVPSGGRLIDGYMIPGNIIVGVPSYSLHRLDYAFSEPFKFIPERWLNDEGSVDRQRVFLPFGGGSRQCIGKFLAQAEMRSLLHAVYSRYRTIPAKDMDACMDLDDQVLVSRPKGTSCKLEFVPAEA
ncbi:unnamed protein product [Clonostachys byssicola]|uniref:Cytochrome P450 n=1 Tax=Clonostachys byssicola TaxID=160290 RepID=A0A9N9U4F5_9HYPO|nr:unnamed protein product [Clonostachys byssicola]